MFDIKTSRASVSAYLMKALTDEIQITLFYYNLEQRIELASHLIESMQLLEGLYDENGKINVAVWESYYQKEDELAHRYGKNFGPFTELDMLKYFDLQNALSETGLVEPEVFKTLLPEEQNLTVGEFRDFITLTKDYLRVYRRGLYLNKQPDGIAKGSPANPPESEQQDTEITRARQLLAFYYLLQLVGINKLDNPSTSVAKLLHLLTGVKYTTIANSEIYKKYKRMPNYKKDAGLITDLRFIRPYFAELRLDEALKEIDKEIITAIEELPISLKKKYREE